MRIARIVLTGLVFLMVIINVCPASASGPEFTPAEQAFIQQHPVIRLGADPQYVPYEFFDSDGQYKGIAADYIKIISERTGIVMEVEQNLTWTQAYEKAAEKKLDVLPCVSKTREREQYFLFSQPYFSFQRVVVMKDNNQTVAKLEDLFNKKVAVKKDSAHHSYLKTFGSIEFSVYPSEAAALKAVADGSETYFVGNLATSSYLIKTNGLTNLKYVQITTEEKQYLYFAVRNDWPELVGIINKGLDSITEAEKIEINNRWIGIENRADYSAIMKNLAIIGAIIAGIFMVSCYWILRLRREVDERIRVQEALKIAKEEAEVANQIKSTFLARMSHEIRTPLNAITGMAYLLKKTRLTAAQKLYLDKITHTSWSMLGIINDILDFSKIEAGKIEIERVSFNLDKVLQNVINIVSYRIEEHGIELVLQKDPRVPVHYWGDPTRLEQILVNIVNNAVKFTLAGVVSISVRLHASQDDMHEVEFSITDTGIGMTREQLERLFQPFDQGDSSINRRFGGTGLGLSIVWSLVEMLQGNIQVDSTPGEGSVFTIRLPMEIDRAAEAEEKNKSASDFLKNIRALVLEKSPTYAHLLNEYLTSFGISASILASPDEALRLLREALHPYDLLIVDHDTPSAGGIDYIGQIKDDPSIKMKPRSILMIPLLREDLFEAVEEAGIDFGISKPIIASILYNGIIELFGRGVLAAQDRFLEVDNSVQFIADYPYHILIVEDNKTNQFIARTILEEAGFKVSLADNGQLGLDYYREHKLEIDLILMDLHMPVLNGYEAAGAIRQLNTGIPMVAMTADAIAGVEAQCRSVGIDHYISKPFDPKQFVATIWNVLESIQKGHRKMEPDIGGSQEINSPSDNALDQAVLDQNDGVKRLGNNHDLYLLVLDEYNREHKDLLAELNQIMDAGRYPEAVQIIHKIKSSSGNIGARRLIAIAGEFQKVLSQGDAPEIQRLHLHFQAAFKELFEEIARQLQEQ